MLLIPSEITTSIDISPSQGSAERIWMKIAPAEDCSIKIDDAAFFSDSDTWTTVKRTKRIEDATLRITKLRDTHPEYKIGMGEYRVGELYYSTFQYDNFERKVEHLSLEIRIVLNDSDFELVLNNIKNKYDIRRIWVGFAHSERLENGEENRLNTYYEEQRNRIEWGIKERTDSKLSVQKFDISFGNDEDKASHSIDALSCDVSLGLNSLRELTKDLPNQLLQLNAFTNETRRNVLWIFGCLVALLLVVIFK